MPKTTKHQPAIDAVISGSLTLKEAAKQFQVNYTYLWDLVRKAQGVKPTKPRTSPLKALADEVRELAEEVRALKAAQVPPTPPRPGIWEERALQAEAENAELKDEIVGLKTLVEALKRAKYPEISEEIDPVQPEKSSISVEIAPIQPEKPSETPKNAQNTPQPLPRPLPSTTAALLALGPVVKADVLDVLTALRQKRKLAALAVDRAQSRRDTCSLDDDDAYERLDVLYHKALDEMREIENKMIEVARADPHLAFQKFDIPFSQ